MNQRIKDLAEQAGFTGQGFQNTVPGTCQETALENFADLIVQEICKELDRAQWDKGEDWVCANGTRIIPQIKQHFGVEE